MVEEAGFDRFWAEYPKKRSKGDAYKAWRATKAQRPDVEKIVKALKVLKGSEDWRRDGGQYIPYPGTWIRAWGWEDVAEVDMKDVLANGKLWYESVSGTEAKARELGIKEWTGFYENRGETWQQWAKRVRAIAESNKVVPIIRVA